jgi:urease accessory protein
MLVADTYRGHADDPALAVDLDDPVRIVIDDTERRRSRFRTVSADGREVGVTVGRVLRDGDVLDADGTPVVVSLEPVAAYAVDLVALDAAAGVRLGHALGNRHRNLTIRDERVLVPIEDDHENRGDELRAHLPPSATIERTTVPPSVFDDESGGHDHGNHRHAHDHPSEVSDS